MAIKRASDVIGIIVAAKKLVTNSPQKPISNSSIKKAGIAGLNFNGFSFIF